MTEQGRIEIYSVVTGNIVRAASVRKFSVLHQLRFDFFQQHARLLARFVGRDACDDRGQPRRSVTFQQMDALFRRSEDSKKVPESFPRLSEKVFHPAPTFRLRAFTIGLKVERHVERARAAAIRAAVLGGVLIDLAARRGKSFQRRRQGHPAVAQAADALESVFISVRDNPDRYTYTLRRMRENAYIVQFVVAPLVTDGLLAPKPAHDLDAFA